MAEDWDVSDDETFMLTERAMTMQQIEDLLSPIGWDE
jgi:hypothetical protein